jgi:hypothetical protein
VLLQSVLKLKKLEDAVKLQYSRARMRAAPEGPVASCVRQLPARRPSRLTPRVKTLKRVECEAPDPLNFTALNFTALNFTASNFIAGLYSRSRVASVPLGRSGVHAGLKPLRETGCMARLSPGADGWDGGRN